MLKNIKGVKVNYFFHDIGADVSLVLLHGWNQNIEMMMPIGEKFFDRYNVLIIDLPGFGKSEEPKEVWSIYDYSSLVHDLINELKINNPILIGHSFGGNIALVYASLYDVNAL